MDLKEIQNLIKFVSKSGVNEVKLEAKDFKITIKIGVDAGETTIVHQAPVASVPVAVASVPVEAVTPAIEENSNLLEVTSPIIGTFYRRPSPDKVKFC